LVFAAVSSMKTIRVGSRSSCPSNHASRAAFTALRRCSAACAVFFARDLATLEELPQCADGDAALVQPLPQFRQRNVALGANGRKDQLRIRLVRCEWRSPLWRLGLTSPSRRSMARHRIALDALTPNR
jgi:hypothetical protein